jgi:predicted subunit of tRNA(5-methylaminomethyl-2-thiouridylate) methyltransferase
LPVAPGKIIAGDNKIDAAVPVAVLALADDIIVLDAVELVLDELAIDDAILFIDELELEIGVEDGVDDCAVDDIKLLLDTTSYTIGNNGFPWSEFFCDSIQL